MALVGLVARTMAAQAAPDTNDVAFMQGMIAHHAQALAMVALIPSHTSRQSIQLIGERIKISQQDEIALMQHWLQDHNKPVTVVDSNDVAHMPGMEGMTMMMPGMLTPEQMTQLAQAKGSAFDTLFLKDMIGHHEGAIRMVKDLFAIPGAGQAPEVFTFASGADADQRAEILRMRSVLNAISNGGSKS
ncbi:MAG TPA: DUF305 domain-containing protein [Gemmatimonadaceae bacterium]|jgi:uncharacterized protein (DUF305 family)|nr:DUF305 domain-containing protein [Gemmatimonadaceae bacterium]